MEGILNVIFQIDFGSLMLHGNIILVNFIDKYILIEYVNPNVALYTNLFPTLLIKVVS